MYCASSIEATQMSMSLFSSNVEARFILLHCPGAFGRLARGRMTMLGSLKRGSAGGGFGWTIGFSWAWPNWVHVTKRVRRNVLRNAAGVAELELVGSRTDRSDLEDPLDQAWTESRGCGDRKEIEEHPDPKSHVDISVWHKSQTKRKTRKRNEVASARITLGDVLKRQGQDSNDVKDDVHDMSDGYSYTLSAPPTSTGVVFKFSTIPDHKPKSQRRRVRGYSMDPAKEGELSEVSIEDDDYDADDAGEEDQAQVTRQDTTGASSMDLAVSVAESTVSRFSNMCTLRDAETDEDYERILKDHRAEWYQVGSLARRTSLGVLRKVAVQSPLVPLLKTLSPNA
ncbi:hypothetical protein FIBSPDRAFT_941290 [Athelia psychrophila]|uniref:Uncharacterized protein n=1 Tax=Athelia psychrophila TaxID=1759441 RepID=A0A167UF48_9AGAM|nr:hypothetical protein FIBSPDRAFT_941290 [Fibularhizoctonia sp. CBS 109695]